MSTITLPDNISFEEIAGEWCEQSLASAITFNKTFNGKVYMKFVEYFYFGESYSAQRGVADFFPADLKIDIKNSEKFQPILDYIKERSHG
jgi:hypothetical protein